MADLLIVDNDARIADLVAFFLRRSGHTVRTAANFRAARVEIASARPDLMLSDLDLGDELGLVELPRLAAEGILPTTLVVSGYLDRAAQIELERVPEVVGVVAKPFDLDVLLARVNEALRVRVLRGQPVPTSAEGDGDDGWIELGAAEDRA